MRPATLLSGLFVLNVALTKSFAGPVTQNLVYALPFQPGTLTFPTRVVPFSRQDTDTVNVNFDFPKFDPSLGSLLGIDVRYAGTVSATFDGTILAPPSVAAGVNANMHVRPHLSPPGAATPVSNDLFFNKSGTFTPSQLSIHFDYPEQPFDLPLLALPPSAFSLYEGQGTVRLPLDIEFVQEATISNTGMSYHFTATPNERVVLTYHYVPEPSSLVMMGLLVLLLLRGRIRS